MGGRHTSFIGAEFSVLAYRRWAQEGEKFFGRAGLLRSVYSK